MDSSVGQALDKLRETNVPETKLTRLDGKIDRLDEEIERLKATRRSLERNQRAGSTGRDVQEANGNARPKADNIMDHSRGSYSDRHLGVDVHAFVAFAKYLRSN